MSSYNNKMIMHDWKFSYCCCCRFMSSEIYCLILKIKALWHFKTSATDHPMAKYHIPEDFKLQKTISMWKWCKVHNPRLHKLMNMSYYFTISQITFCKKYSETRSRCPRLKNFPAKDIRIKKHQNSLSLDKQKCCSFNITTSENISHLWSTRSSWHKFP